MKVILLSDLRTCPEAWNLLITAGMLRGGELIIDEGLVGHLKVCGHPIPSIEWGGQPIPLPKRIDGTGAKLPDSVRLERLALCGGCEHNKDGLCAKCQTCSGRKIEWKVHAVFEFCPIAKWGQFLSPEKALDK